MRNGRSAMRQGFEQVLRVAWPVCPWPVAMIALLVIGGCRGGLKGVQGVSPPGQSPTVIRAQGDWDDIEAAAIVAAGKVEMAVLMVTPGDDRVVIDLTTIRDEPARMVVRRPAGDPAGETLELEARVGRFGDPDRELGLLGAMARRLKQLHGRDWAPR